MGLFFDMSLRMKLLWLPSLFQVITLQYRCKEEDSNIIIHQNGSTSLLKLLCETENVQQHCFKAKQYHGLVHVSSTSWVVCGCHTSQKDSALLWHDMEHKTWPLLQQGIRASRRDPRIYNNKSLLLPGLIVSACERARNWDSSLGQRLCGIQPKPGMVSFAYCHQALTSTSRWGKVMQEPDT